MPQPLVTDDLWTFVTPPLPPHPPQPRSGRPLVDDRACLDGVLFVLKAGIAWQDLPREMGCGSGMTCWRRLRDWRRAGVWQRLHELLLARLPALGRIDPDRVVVDGSSVRALKGATRPARARRTAAGRAQSTTSRRTAAASRSRHASPGRTGTT